jgi:hypothetical protein
MLWSITAGDCANDLSEISLFDPVFCVICFPGASLKYLILPVVFYSDFSVAKNMLLRNIMSRLIMFWMSLNRYLG